MLAKVNSLERQPGNMRSELSDMTRHIIRLQMKRREDCKTKSQVQNREIGWP
jgi:hypothetical protein